MRWFLLTLGLLAVPALAQTPPPPAGQTATQDALKLGVQLYALGRYEAALEALERAAKEKPQDPDVLYWLARAQLKVGLLNPALENAKGLVARNPRYIGGYMVLAEAYIALYRASEDREKARAYLDQALSVLRDGERVNPRYAPLFAQRGLVYALLGQMDRAEEAFRRALSLEDTPEVRVAMAELYLAAGRLDEALGQYARALQLAPKDSGVRLRYASALLLKGRAEEAARVLEEGHKLKPLDAEGWYTLGQAYVLLGRMREAGVALENAIALAPLRFPAAYYYLGQVYLALGDAQKAKSRLTVAVRLEPKRPEYRYQLCLANERLGDKEGARYQCQEAVKLKPGYKEAEEVLRRL
ncbi:MULTISPECIES: tetratricopeptide repeat protein [Thermus]|jgi:tetratricopeptide (TPR) repeat protein|uniref:O-linked GlcNAc transferase n=1 Tax=Thermus brockianus TaxID=56956 RepID=A0A1J0LQ23_THEBO|nr:tetratricopeptide repeat protein [Thermus brockianus]APD08376.1 O-linked GlcNAc transferase [Thermus brockianus]BDG16276.1 O-linked GlcNAc transferase [Thermus brockianus]